MKKHIFTFTLLLISNILFAQGSFFVGAQGSINYTSLLNKEDRKADDRLDYVTTIKPAYGVVLGYKIHNNIGLRSITTGIGFSQVSQHYTGTLVTNGIKSMQAQTNLKYIKIPIEFNFAFAKEKHIIPILTLGVHVNYLKNYLDSMSAITGASHDGKPDWFKVSEPNYYSAYNTSLTFGDKRASIDKDFYQKWNFGATLGAGAEIVLSNKFSTSLMLKCDYGITDSEYKGNVKYNGQSPAVSVWGANYAKYYNRDPLNNPGSRPATHNLLVGLQLSFYWHIDGGLSDFDNKNY